jgi:DNA invertase Pin-like site-specific DNA recombinase
LGAAAALANQIDVAVRRVSERIAAAVQAKAAPPKPTGGATPLPQPTRKLKQLRPRDVDTVTRISSTDDWERFKTKLDARVRDALDNGYDVELS